jgi:thiol-disulfide isomerase/thioredoxin
VRVVAYVCLVAGCVALAGCGTFGKKAQQKPKEPASPAADAGWPASSEGAAAAPAERPPAGLGGLLAGRVLDSFDRPPPPTYIKVLLAQDTPDSKSAPLEVATDNQGYFTIQGLKAGQHYQLIARTRDGDPKLAGTTWATPPNPRILIFVSQDFATPNTPPPPAPPTVPERKPNSAAASPPANGATPKKDTGEANHDPAKPSAIRGPASGGADIGPPMKLGTPATPPNVSPSQSGGETRLQDIAGTPEARGNVPPVTNIPSQGDLGRQFTPTRPLAGAPPFPEPAARVPSCVLTGKQLHNFALYDLQGRPWEYRHHHGRLVLLVFWETTCMPCRAAIPYLKTMQERYGPSGFEIIAIAYEQGSLQEQIRRVQNLRDRLQIPYRLLLGGDVSSCPVRTQFAVHAFPTVVLLDESSRIIWQRQGLDATTLRELEMRIKLKLGQP